MESIELKLAYEWECPKCKLTQYESGIIQELTPQEKEYIASKSGVLREDLDSELIRPPEEVQCNKCGEKFLVNFAGNEQYCDDEDDEYWEDEDDDWYEEDWSERDEDYQTGSDAEED